MARKSKYIHLYQTKQAHDADYSRSSANYLEPWVAYVTATDEVTYNLPHDYSFDYLTTTARESGTISFNILSSMGTEYITSISFSTDNGKTWNTTANTDNKQQNLVIDVNVEAGDKVLWKGEAEQTGVFDGEENSNGSFFSSSGEFDVEGNVMSLLYGDDFVGETTLENDGAFTGLFFAYWKGKSCGIVNAENMILPATTLASACYAGMFAFCTSLTSAPALPSTTLTMGCYYDMFTACISLATAPELPATTLADYCYYEMFRGCVSLISAPPLPATTLADGCYNYMFYGCSRLNYIKAMFTTTPSTTYTDNWVDDVASSGTFVKNSTATWNVTGTHGIPSGWTVETASE